MNKTIHKNTANFLLALDEIDYSGLSLCAALRYILDAIQVLLPYCHANVWLTNEVQDFGSLTFPQTLSLVTSAGMATNEQVENTYVNLNDSFSGRTIVRNKIFYNNDLFTEALFKNKKYLHSIGARAGISVPLRGPIWFREPRLTGVLNLYFKKLPKVSNIAIEFIASQVSNAIEKLKIIHRDQVTSRLLPYSSGSIETHFKHSLAAMKNYGIEAASIFTFDRSRNKLCLVATTGIKDCSDNKLVRYDLGYGLTGHVGKFCKSIIVHDLHSKEIKTIHAGAFIEITKIGVRSFMACPITNKEGKLVGTIRCVNKYLNETRIASFSQIDLNIVRRIAEILCQHMERASLERSREALLAKIPHDLKAPIVAVRNNASNIKEFRNRPEFNVDRKLDDIVDDCNILFLLLQHVKRTQNYSYSKFQLKSVIVKLIKELRPMARSNGIRLDYEQSIDIIQSDMYFDKAQMQHLFFNLIGNAIKYSFSDTDIILSARRIDNYIAIDILNWGIGVRERYKDAIFEPETRTPEAIEIDATGTGWGLAICQEIAEKHEGKVLLTRGNSPTIFTVYLPKYLAERTPI